MVRAIRGLKRPGGVRQGSIAGWRGQAAAAAPGAGAAAEYRFGRCGAAAGKGGPGAPHWLGGGERPTRLQPRNFALQRTGCSFSHLPRQPLQPRKSASFCGDTKEFFVLIAKYSTIVSLENIIVY